ncbi:MAG: hypothetical protein JO018_02100 [Candidatus Eremiobacteraeota bacterium]|nr:hypothetical protein [Candidatus Eremiobacteraeota bacterium]
MIRNVCTAIIATALGLFPMIAAAQITPGTDLVGTMDQNLSSRDAVVGQPFTISNVHSLNYNISGATIYGHVAAVQRAGQGTPARIELEFDKLNTRSGNVYHIVGYTTNVQVNTRPNTGKEAAAAAGGALLGSLLTHRWLGTIAGAAGGYMLAKNNRANVDIPASSVVSVRVQQSRRQTGHY